MFDSYTYIYIYIERERDYICVPASLDSEPAGQPACRPGLAWPGLPGCLAAWPAGQPCLFVCLPACRPAGPAARLSTRLSTGPPACLPACQTVARFAAAACLRWRQRQMQRGVVSRCSLSCFSTGPQG